MGNLKKLYGQQANCSVPEIIDLVFTKTSPKRSFCMTENERFGVVFVKTGSIISGTGVYSGIFCPTGIFWREAKTKRLFSQCSSRGS